MMSHGSKFLLFFVAGVFAGMAPAGAAVITALPGGTAVVIPVIAGEDPDATTRGPVTFGPGIRFASTANSLVGYTGDYGFTATNMWSGAPMIGLNAARGTMTLTFATPLAGFLADIATGQYISSADGLITAYDPSGRMLDRIVMEHDGYKVQPGVMGFAYTDATIGKITFAGEYIGLRAISVRLADASGAVPEPATWALTILGMGAIGAALRRRRGQPGVTAIG